MRQQLSLMHSVHSYSNYYVCYAVSVSFIFWVIAGTGTGKTLSFVLPLLERMSADGLIRSERGRPPCTLVMAPTRELANQVRQGLLESVNWF